MGFCVCDFSFTPESGSSVSSPEQVSAARKHLRIMSRAGLFLGCF